MESYLESETLNKRVRENIRNLLETFGNWDLGRGVETIGLFSNFLILCSRTISVSFLFLAGFYHLALLTYCVLY